MSYTEDLSYFQNVRRDIEPLLGPRPARILEVGCGGGNTLAWLKRRWPDAETVGVDGYAPIEPELARRVDRALIHDLEQPLPDLGRFDLILALDVLEHLRDPWSTMADLAGRLSPDGMVIISVPNIGHYSVTVPLLLRGDFEYEDAGILDRTHLRFFSKRSALELIRSAGLTVTGAVATGHAGIRQNLANRLSLGLLRHFTTNQFVMRGERQGSGRFKWRMT